MMKKTQFYPPKSTAVNTFMYCAKNRGNGFRVHCINSIGWANCEGNPILSSTRGEEGCEMGKS